MPVSKAQVRNADYGPKPVRFADFTETSAGDQSIPSGETKEIAYLKVGEVDEVLESYIAWLLGQNPDSQLRSAKGKLFANFSDNANSSDGDAINSLQWRVVGREETDLDGQPLMEWLTHGETKDTDDYAGTYPVQPRKPIVRESRVIAVQVRQTTGNSINIDWDNCQGKLPGRGGK